MPYNDITRRLAADNRALKKVIRKGRYFTRKRRIIDKRILLLFILSFSFLILLALEHRFISSHIIIKSVLQEGINYDAFREMKLDKKTIEEAENKISHILKKEPDLASLDYLDAMGYITFSMLVNNYDLINNALVSEATFLKGVNKIKENEAFQELYGYYSAVLSGLAYFPVPKLETAEVSYTDSWYQLRTYGGNRRHEGCDLMASNNKRGFFPIISITDGVVEKMGWLDQGGYRIGIRTERGGYFYYAHLFSYAPELQIGDTVLAGQLLGFMGDSGYGPEGTIGQFDVHLHLGIYVNSSIGEMSVNPFQILKILETKRKLY